MENDEDFWAEVKHLGPWLFAYSFFDQIVPHVSSPRAHEVIDRRFGNFMRIFEQANIPRDSSLIDFPCGDRRSEVSVTVLESMADCFILNSDASSGITPSASMIQSGSNGIGSSC